MITNKYGLPQTFVRFLERDPYTKEGADFSVTELINPPRIAQLSRRHEVDVDVSGCMRQLLGTAIHYVLEKGAGKEDEVEQRFFLTIDGTTVSGQVDLIEPIPKHEFSVDDKDVYAVRDYKSTSTWGIIYNPDGKQEWHEQLNMYKLLRSMGKTTLDDSKAENFLSATFDSKHFDEMDAKNDVDLLDAVVILTDWTPSKVGKSRDYPDQSVKSVPIPQWGMEEIFLYLLGRMQAHTHASALPDDQLPECTPEERWAEGGKWAVHKTSQNGKPSARAVRVFDDESEALQCQRDLQYQTSVVKRFGNEYKRCEMWCPVAAVCNQYKTAL